MDVLTLVRVLIRRWYVLVPALVVAYLAVAEMTGRYEPQYTAASSIMFVDPVSRVPPNEQRRPLTRGARPYLDVLAGTLEGSETEQLLQSQGMDVELTVEADSEEPIVGVRATGPRDQVVPAVDAIVAMLGALVEESQVATGAPREDFVEMRVVETPAPVQVRLGQRRAELVALLLGVSGAVGVTVIVDGLIRRRRVDRGDGRSGRHDAGGPGRGGTPSRPREAAPTW